MAKTVDEYVAALSGWQAETVAALTRWLGYGRGQTSTTIRNDSIQR